MNKKQSFKTLRSLAYWGIVLGLWWYFCQLYGTYAGSLLYGLHWSMYILCIPGGHGQWLFGYPIRKLTGYNLHTELLFIPLALGYVITLEQTLPTLFEESFCTMILHRLINIPNPYWSIFCVSALGSLYFYWVNEDFFARSAIKHTFIRTVLLFIGITYFCILTHKEFIILLNASS